MKKNILKGQMNEFIDSFLIIVSSIVIMCIQYITEKLALSKYMNRDKDGIIHHIIIYIFMIIFAIPILIFMRYLEIDIDIRDLTATFKKD